MRGSCSALLLLSALLENFLRFHFASLEHYASSAERVLPAPVAKIRQIPETNKHFGNYFIIQYKFAPIVSAEQWPQEESLLIYVRTEVEIKQNNIACSNAISDSQISIIKLLIEVY